MASRAFTHSLYFVVLAWLVLNGSATAQHGIVLSGGGPVHRSMGGASTAAPVDAAGALFWNPATISGLQRSELTFGMELLYADAELSSLVQRGSLGGGAPPVTLAGRDRSDNGLMPIPSVAWVHQPQDSPLTMGLGIFIVGGFSVNYPASAVNPILTAPPPAGVGLGAISADLQVLQLAPTLAYQITPRLSIGIAPTVTLARLTADPFFVAPPDDANGNGFPTFAAGTHTRWHGGGGGQIGLYYAHECGWALGASVKSPQWLESFRYKGSDELGRPRDLKTHFDYPMIVSVGGAYSALERWIFAIDARYIDYHNTEGFESTGFAPNGSVRGLGWDSIFVIAAGAQFLVCDALSVRMGYTFNTNPIDDAVSSFNVASPVIIQHTLYLGASWNINEWASLSMAYAHAFENSINGPILSPLGAIPGSSVGSDVSADAVMLGATVRY